MMNLKTHTGYPEIQVDEDFNWVAKIIASDGEVLQEFTSDDFDKAAESRPEASEQASIMIAGVEDDYLRPVEEESEEVNTKEGA